MNKNSIAKKAVASALAATMMVNLVGCNSETKYYDNEVDSLIFATLEVDRVFNPFYSTSATDGEVVGLTQIGMISNDSEGKPVYGDDAPTTVVEDLEITTEWKDEAKTEADTTTYKFVLRNDIKFSDGSPLTIKDVLFNLYVYLDMAYTGSTTIYSTDIVGLKAYRTQAATENEQDKFMVQFQNAATQRIDSLAEVSFDIIDENENVDFTVEQFRAELEKREKGDAYAHLTDDYDKAIELFAKELESDWSNALNTYSEFVLTDKAGKEYKNLFSTDVEMFLYNEGYITWNRKDGLLESRITNDVSSLKSWSKEQAIEYVYVSKVPAEIEEIITMWGTADELNTHIVNAEMEEHFSSADSLAFPNVEGIRFANGGADRLGADSVQVNGKTYGTPKYNVEGKVESGIKSGNEVLSIKINGVDPKAIWNFSFAVAPMYYYSNQEQIDKFDFKSHFGVKYNSQTFMNEVIKNPSRIGVPVGAGPYRASRSTGLKSDTDLPESGEFYDKGSIYFERNNHYVEPVKIKNVRYRVVSSNQMLNNLYTGAVDFATPNAKPETIKEIEKKKKDGVGQESIRTSGYGYIGINAAKVPDLAVRQAIMYCINTQLCVDYYKTTATPIFRSMSTSSWAYPENATAYYPYIGGKIPQDLTVVDPQYKQYVEMLGKRAGETLTEAEQENFIRTLVESADYTENAQGVYAKNSHVCKYTFTIAGESNDHPAWLALYNAGTRLGKYGFSINVAPDANALRKLSTGDLTVWAAAWGSTIDPDMYQVYHKDSTASSVKNWGYPQILRNAGNKYSTENEILAELSELIEKGRETEDQSKRKVFYETALTEVMKLAVELPTYQRDDLFAFNEKKIDTTTFTPSELRSSFKGLTSDIHNVSLVLAS